MRSENSRAPAHRPWPTILGQFAQRRTPDLRPGLLCIGSALHALGELRDELRHRVMLHEKLAELLALGDLEIHGLVELAAREVHGANELLRARREIEVLLVAIHRQQVELPRLAAV